MTLWWLLNMILTSGFFINLTAALFCMLYFSIQDLKK